MADLSPSHIGKGGRLSAVSCSLTVGRVFFLTVSGSSRRVALSLGQYGDGWTGCMPRFRAAFVLCSGGAMGSRGVGPLGNRLVMEDDALFFCFLLACRLVLLSARY